MADDPKKQLLPLLVLTLVLGGAYAGLKYFGADETPAEGSTVAGEAPSTGSGSATGRGASAAAM